MSMHLGAERECEHDVGARACVMRQRIIRMDVEGEQVFAQPDGLEPCARRVDPLLVKFDPRVLVRWNEVPVRQVVELSQCALMNAPTGLGDSCLECVQLFQGSSRGNEGNPLGKRHGS
eukprot:scaffold33667_cov32-Tisochrysis_lutea.AAC.4